MRLDCLAFALAVTLSASACCTAPEQADERKTVIAITASNHLIRFHAGAPGKLLSTKTLTGLQPGEAVLGLDYRAPERWLYAVGSTNRLYRVNPLTAIATPVGERFAVPLTGTYFGIDFDPVEDLLRIVSDTGQNLRIHPDASTVADDDPTQPGAQVDGPLVYATGDPSDQQRPAVVAIACTPRMPGNTAATTYALDAAAGALVTLGNRAGNTPAMPANAGHLFTVGSLGTGPFVHAAFDIVASSGTAFAALTSADAAPSRWVTVDLTTGAARLIGPIGGGEAVIGIAIEP